MIEWDQIEKEWSVIAQAPTTFGIAFLLMGGFLWLLIKGFYKHNLEMKEDAITNLERKIKLIESVPKTTPQTLQPDTPAIVQTIRDTQLSDIEFFQSIDDLRANYPLAKTFKPGNEIHAYFLSGEGVFAEHEEYIKCVRRLILPNPKSENVRIIGELASPPIDYEVQIPKYRNLAKANLIPVRLLNVFSGVSLLVCNPERNDGWVQVGPIIPGLQPSNRHHYRFSKNKHENAFLALYGTFNRLWERSTETLPEEEYISVHDAARKVYEAYKRGEINLPGVDKLSGLTGFNAHSGSEDDKYRWLADTIAQSKDIEMYGTNPPSMVLEIIDVRTKKHFKFVNLATRLEDPQKPYVHFKNLCLKQERFEEWLGFHSGGSL